MSDNDATTESETRPCAHCGRPVPQRAAAGRPFRYCRDNDGECQRASRNSRMRHRSSPGLAGQVARTWEVVDRLDQLVVTLSEALHSELSPAGVERQLAELRAETSGQIAAAHTERDDARRDAERAESSAATAQQLTAAAVAERDEARHQAEESARRAAAAVEAAEAAQRERDEARREATAAAALKERAETEREHARAELTAARAELTAELTALRERSRDELAAAQDELRQSRRERDTLAHDLANAIREARAANTRAGELRETAAALQTAQRDLTDQLTAAATTIADVRRESAARAEQLTAATADRDALRRTHEELQRTVDDLQRTADDLQRTADRAVQDRDDLSRRLTAARADAEAAHARAAQLSAQVSDLASALASLGGARPATPPSQPDRTHAGA